jgi:hypothetical protein
MASPISSEDSNEEDESHIDSIVEACWIYQRTKETSRKRVPSEDGELEDESENEFEDVLNKNNESNNWF